METLPHIIKTVFSFEEAKKYYKFLFRTSLELLMCSVTVLTGGLTKQSTNIFTKAEGCKTLLY